MLGDRVVRAVHEGRSYAQGGLNLAQLRPVAGRLGIRYVGKSRAQLCRAMKLRVPRRRGRPQTGGKLPEPAWGPPLLRSMDPYLGGPQSPDQS
jgi:hypothetical protein